MAMFVQPAVLRACSERWYDDVQLSPSFQLSLTDCSVCFRITDQRYERVPYFVFGDFNFRLDSKQVIEVSETRPG